MKEYDYREIASQYDREVKEYDSYCHDLIFGMCYEYVKPNDKILDIGIGTGLASINFSRMGLKVYGIDNSEEMLKICEMKSFAKELRLYNLSGNRIPYDDNCFNNIISCGVFHFLSGLDTLFSEVARILIKGGVFAFSFAPGDFSRDYSKQMTAWGVPIYMHSPDYIKRLLEMNEMKLVKEQRLLIKGADKVNYDMKFSVMLAQYIYNINYGLLG